MEKIKQNMSEWVGSEKGKDILTIIIIVLVGLGSFLLGRLSKEVKGPTESKLQAAAPIQSISTPKKVSTESSPSGKNFFASSRGTKYYTTGCTSNIKAENKIYFDTAAEAEKAGYELSSSCK